MEYLVAFFIITGAVGVFYTIMTFARDGSTEVFLIIMVILNLTYCTGDQFKANKARCGKYLCAEE